MVHWSAVGRRNKHLTEGRGVEVDARCFNYFWLGSYVPGKIVKVHPPVKGQPWNRQMFSVETPPGSGYVQAFPAKRLTLTKSKEST